MIMTYVEWMEDRAKRQARQLAEWKALDAWWEGYKAALPPLAAVMVSATCTGQDFAAHVERIYRERRQKAEQAIATIWDGFPDEPRPQ